MPGSRSRRWLLVLPLLLAGCAASPGTPAASGGAMAGMSMAPGESMTPTGAPSAAPPAAARMVCGDDIRTQVASVLKLSATPAADSSWAHSVYTCTYRLPMGTMVLSVHVLPSAAAAGTAFDRLRNAADRADALAGLGERAFGTPAGTAVVVKDDMTLTVDTTALPAEFGPDQQKRTDLAYEIASDVLGCWTGDGDE